MMKLLVGACVAATACSPGDVLRNQGSTLTNTDYVGDAVRKKQAEMEGEAGGDRSLRQERPGGRRPLRVQAGGRRLEERLPRVAGRCVLGARRRVRPRDGRLRRGRADVRAVPREEDERPRRLADPRPP